MSNITLDCKPNTGLTVNNQCEDQIKKKEGGEEDGEASDDFSIEGLDCFVESQNSLSAKSNGDGQIGQEKEQ